MKRLNKQHLAEKARISGELSTVAGELQAAIAKYNEAKAEAFAPVEAAVARYNELIAEANAWREGIHADQETYYDEKSEKWQEGDNGSNYAEWRDQFSEELDEIELDAPDDLDEPDLHHSETLDQLPEEPGC